MRGDAQLSFRLKLAAPQLVRRLTVRWLDCYARSSSRRPAFGSRESTRAHDPARYDQVDTRRPEYEEVTVASEREGSGRHDTS